jgi:hypothetical protein
MMVIGQILVLSCLNQGSCSQNIKLAYDNKYDTSDSSIAEFKQKLLADTKDFKKVIKNEYYYFG